MRNSIAISVISSLLSLTAFGQLTFQEKDTLRFAADSSYSRAIIRHEGNLVFGTSKTGVVSLNEQTGASTTLITPVPDGEFRDLIIYDGVLLAIVSGDNGLIMTQNNDQFGEKAEGAFFDDIATNGKVFAILGDPIDGHFLLEFADKTGTTGYTSIENRKEEACYAASGTTAQFVGSDYCFVSGGLNAARFHKVFVSNPKTASPKPAFSTDLPIVKGEGAGPFSVHFTDKKCGVIVGGNYTQPKDTAGTCVYTSDGGKTWTPSRTMPNGYRSCVTGTKKLLFCCGTTGIDVSRDGGKTWQPFDKGNFCALLLEKKTLYATTNKGYCIRYKL